MCFVVVVVVAALLLTLFHSLLARTIEFILNVDRYRFKLWWTKVRIPKYGWFVASRILVISLCIFVQLMLLFVYGVLGIIFPSPPRTLPVPFSLSSFSPSLSFHSWISVKTICNEFKHTTLISTTTFSISSFVMYAFDNLIYKFERCIQIFCLLNHLFYLLHSTLGLFSQYFALKRSVQFRLDKSL